MTKLIITISILVLSVTNSLTAQFGLGVKAGLASNDVHANVYIDAVNNAPKGYTAGIYGITAEMPIHSNISIVSELLKTNKGFVIDESTTFDLAGINIPVGGRVTTSINYVETPLLLKGIIGNSGIQGYGLVGPSLGYATSAKLQPTATLLIDYNLPEVDIDLSSEMYNRWDISAVVGAGAQIEVGQGKIFADLRYQLGLRDMVNSSGIEMDLKARAVQVSVGYAYTF